MKTILKLSPPVIGLFGLVFCFLFGVILMGEEDQSASSSVEVGLNLSPEVLKQFGKIFATLFNGSFGTQ